MTTEGWAQGRRKAGHKEEGPGPRYCALSVPTLATSPPLHTTWALAFCLFLISSLPLPSCRGPATEQHPLHSSG